MNTRIAMSSLMLVVGAVVLAVPVMKGTEQIEATVAETDTPVAAAKRNPWSKDNGAGTVPATAPASAPTIAPAQVSLAQETSSWGRQVTLYRYPDGHFYADVVVDGQQLHMLVDTGASVIALTGADAQRLGVSWNSFELSTIGQGASGPVEGVGTKLRRVALGGIETRDVTAVVIPEGLHVSLLGQSFLTELGRVEITGDRMVIGD